VIQPINGAVEGSRARQMDIWKHIQAIIVLPVIGTVVVPAVILFLTGNRSLAFHLVLRIALRARSIEPYGSLHSPPTSILLKSDVTPATQ
jgi:hypothetical protein